MAQFQGESAWDAFVNHESLDIEEEEAFLDYVLIEGHDPDMMTLEALAKDWQQYQQSH